MRSRRASAAVNNLKHFHEKKKKGLKPHSLYLDHIIRKSVSSHNRRDSRVHKDIYVIKVKINIFYVFSILRLVLALASVCLLQSMWCV